MLPPSAAAERLPSLHGRRVALVSSGKVNADRLFAELGNCLQERYRVAEVRLVTKPSSSVPAPPELIGQLAEWAHAAVVGPGD